MADSTASLRRQIDSAADLQSVVRAMKAQAAASIGQYAESVAALDDYALTVELGLGAGLRQRPPAPALIVDRHVTEMRPIRVVIFGSDQGLVGRFNDTLAEFFQRSSAEDLAGAQIWGVGERIRDSLADLGLVVQGTLAVPATVQGITRLVTEVLVDVIDSKPNRAGPAFPAALHLFYNQPTTGSSSIAVGRRLLPLDDAWRLERARLPWPTRLRPQLLDSFHATMHGLIREYLFVSIFRASAQSLASENASRLAAMDRADRNIDKMLLRLNDRFHRLRQSKIDEELSDVIAGFKALSG